MLLALGAGAVALAAAPEPRLPPAISFEGAYTAEVLAVANGGLHRGAVFRGLAEAAVQADLAAFGAPAGSVFRLSALAPHGGDFSGTRLGDLQGASNIAACNQPLLYELWLAGEFVDHRLDLRVGRLLADGDFATTDTGGVFLNGSFGWPAFISGNTRNAGPAFDRSALGAFAGVRLSQNLRVQAGVYDGDAIDDATGDPAAHANGLNFELGHGQGAFAIVEVVFETVSGPAAAGRPGALKLGAWRHTAEFADQFDPAQSHSGNHGIYLVAEQMLWRESDRGRGEPQGLTVFARTGVSPGDRSIFTQTADAGLGYTGLLPGREADKFGLGLAWVRIGGDARRAGCAAGAAVLPDYELTVEASYEIAASERWRVVPDLQWVRHPGGSAARQDALVLGLRTRLAF